MLWVVGDDKVDHGENGCSLTTGQKCAPGGKDKCPAGPWWSSEKRIAIRGIFNLSGAECPGKKSRLQG